MVEEWAAFTAELVGDLRKLRGATPEVMRTFSSMAQSALSGEGLDVKTKELIALAVSVAVRCDDCIGFHAQSAVKAGATRQELAQALGMAIYMGAGPSVMYASHALAAFDQFAETKA